MPGVCQAFGAATPSRALVSRSLVQQDKSNARPTTTMFAAFLAPSVIEHTYGSMRHLLVCQLHLVKRPVNHPRCSQRLEVFATTVSVTDQQEMQQCTSDGHFFPEIGRLRCKKRCPRWANSGHRRYHSPSRKMSVITGARCALARTDFIFYLRCTRCHACKYLPAIEIRLLFPQEHPHPVRLGECKCWDTVAGKY